MLLVMEWKMKMSTIVVLIVCLGLSDGLKRKKRSLIQLAEQIKSLTGKDPLKYNGYGCYCGWGGSGATVDEVDKCCQHHDNCYGSVTNDLPECEPKWNQYTWDIKGETIDCLDQASSSNLDKLLMQQRSSQNCPRRICECDKALVECLYKNPYHSENYGLNKELRCKQGVTNNM